MADSRFFFEHLLPGMVRLSDAEASHARQSRRLSVEDRVVLFDGQGHESLGRVVSATRAGVEVAIEHVVHRPRPTPKLTLAVSLPKGPRQDTLIEKCTELGVAKIQPLITQRTNIAPPSDHKLGKWRRTTIEAAKQSGQCWLPVLNKSRELKEVLSDLTRFDLVILAAPARDDQPEARTITDWLPNLSTSANILGFIGPEGGWTDEEIDSLITAGAQPVSLGPNTLRVETAAIALAAAVHALARHS